MKADRRLYLTSDKSRIVEHGDPDGAWLLVAEGRRLYPGVIDRYGLSLVGGRVHYDGAPELPALDEPEGEAPEEGTDTDEGLVHEEGEAEEGAPDGWPDGYTWERAGAYYAVRDPDGEPVPSDTPSGKWNGQDAAQEAAWRHARGD